MEAHFSINRDNGDLISYHYHEMIDQVEYKTKLITRDLFQNIIVHIDLSIEKNDPKHLSFSWSSQPADGSIDFDVEILVWDEYTIDLLISQ